MKMKIAEVREIIKNTPKATVYQPIKWEYIKLAETVINSDVYTIPKQQKPFGPMQWNRAGWTVIIMPLLS